VIALWLVVIILAATAARVCWHLQAAAHQWRNENPTEQDVDNTLDQMEAHNGNTQR
jgi:hypothetical protein